MLVIINKIDFGIIGDHCRISRLPSEKTETVNCSIKLLDLPIPKCAYGLYKEWYADCPDEPATATYLRSLKSVRTHLNDASATGLPTMESDSILALR